ncbi:hypothetical protein [Streptomyces sp. NPDC050263]|uniref:hypothetical protein n=1 Tax=Streptomyces sp. NPDC050263 TaxID=3155037 RepID=UPI00342EC32F
MNIDAERAGPEGPRVVHGFTAPQSQSQSHVTPNPSPKQRAAWDRGAPRELTGRHERRRGDPVIRGDTGMPHRALRHEQSSSRLMHRTSLAGEEAIA